MGKHCNRAVRMVFNVLIISFLGVIFGHMLGVAIVYSTHMYGDPDQIPLQLGAFLGSGIGAVLGAIFGGIVSFKKQ